MKIILSALGLSIVLTTCYLSYDIAEPAVNRIEDTYVILQSGEKIKNIASSKWRANDKTVDITVGDRVIDPAAIRWIRDAEGLWLMCRGVEYKCEIEGKISVYHTRNASTSRYGSPLHPVTYYILLKGETILNRRFSYRNLLEAMADNEGAILQLNKIHHRVVNRDLMRDQLKVVKYFNEQ